MYIKLKIATYLITKMYKIYYNRMLIEINNVDNDDIFEYILLFKHHIYELKDIIEYNFTTSNQITILNECIEYDKLLIDKILLIKYHQIVKCINIKYLDRFKIIQDYIDMYLYNHGYLDGGIEYDKFIRKYKNCLLDEYKLINE